VAIALTSGGGNTAGLYPDEAAAHGFRVEKEPLGTPDPRSIEAALESMLGYDVSVFLRSADEIRAIAAQEPFSTAQVERSKGKLQVMMLSGKPAAGARKSVLALATDDDALAFGERELYWLPSGGISDSNLDLKGIGQVLGTNTIRTKGTVEQMAAKFFAE
jgi:uncharacterized protein (DUF1697 family)